MVSLTSDLLHAYFNISNLNLNHAVNTGSREEQPQHNLPRYFLYNIQSTALTRGYSPDIPTRPFSSYPTKGYLPYIRLLQLLAGISPAPSVTNASSSPHLVKNWRIELTFDRLRSPLPYHIPTYLERTTVFRSRMTASRPSLPSLYSLVPSTRPGTPPLLLPTNIQICRLLHTSSAKRVESRLRASVGGKDKTKGGKRIKG